MCFPASGEPGDNIQRDPCRQLLLLRHGYGPLGPPSMQIWRIRRTDAISAARLS